MSYIRFSFISVKRTIDIRKIIGFIMTVIVLTSTNMCTYNIYGQEISTDDELVPVAASDLAITSDACVLMEASTGTVLYEKAKDEKVSPASITKIMTLLLIFEELEKGTLKLDDEVVTSSYAMSMGGSQVFLEEGEIQSVETLIKCIVIASGNDACVAMAEHIAGSEAKFVEMMNVKATSLGMINTHFEDCCGLTDSDNHYTSAMDVAIMSRELIVKYPQIHQYSTIWMENITHNTRTGSSEFGLANTNKLLKQYPYTTGLKTGSTSKAKYCVSATAKKDDIEMIAVIMGAPNYKVRFSEAESLLKYGYGTCKLYKDSNDIKLKELTVISGVKKSITCVPKSGFSYVLSDGASPDSIEKKISYLEKIVAPVEKGAKVGEITYVLDGKEIGKVDIISNQKVEKAGFIYSLKRLFEEFLL
ncbi:MAG: D-alanyl-D-alanine carboxypeptidase [Lachnospiraceae bacterium]|nr:D-alanyl-D-alanine carboxypeptidase [Lachnospiraceae bacterium]